MAVAKPLPKGTFSLTAGWRYRTIRPSDHFAYDLAAPIGTRIFSITSGKVVASKDGIWDNFTHGVGGPFSGKPSNYLVIAFRHNGRDHYAYYQHLRRGLRVRTGDTVRAGQHIAAVGLTGNTGGPHLHLAVGNHDYEGNRYSYMRNEGGGAVFPPTAVAQQILEPGTRRPARPRITVRQVQPGMRGPAVLVLQKALKKVVRGFDYSSGPGVFGDRTRDAYKSWQESLYGKGRQSDGKPGEQSLAALARRTGLFRV